jgi:tetratricopeptide (TPR) repeat protein
MTPALTSYVARRYDHAVEALQKIIEMEPNFPAGRSVLGNVYTQLQRYDEAMQEYQKVLELSNGITVLEMNVKAIVARLHAKQGEPEAAKGILDQLSDSAALDNRISQCAVAAVYSELGDREAAFEWLERAYERREPHLVSLKVDPALDGLRGDKRFAELIKRVGLPA